MLFSTNVVPFYTPISSAGVPVSPHLCQHLRFLFLDSGHPNGCAVVTPHSFDLHFPND